MQGRIKRGGGGPGDPADREAAVRRQSSATPPNDTGRDGATDSRQKSADAAKARIGRLAPKRVSGAKRYALSNWRIRTRLLALLVLPVAAAIVLGGFRIQTSLETQNQLTKVAQLGDVAQSATELATALETERDAMAGTITYNGDSSDDTIVHDQKTTTTKMTAFTKLTEQLTLANLPGHGADILDINTKLNTLQSVRENAFAQVGGSDAQALASVNAYENLIQPLLALSQDLALASSNTELVQATRSLQEFSKWKDDQSVIRAVVSAGLASSQKSVKGGGPATSLSADDRAYTASAFNNAKSTKTTFDRLYGSGAAALEGAWTSNIQITRAKELVSNITAAQTGWGSNEAPPSFTTWDGLATAQITAMTSDESILVEQLNAKVKALKDQAQQDVILNAALIALVLLVAVIGAAIVARSMVRTLSTLQSAAEDVAEHRLPELVRVLSESDPQDVDTSVEPIGINTTDEIGHVARAFDQVHAQAVRLAAEQALLRGNINAMFTNLSRRSQGLIQRQLSMISELESREADPDQLASLFKLDHLATRMRRNGENLLVLAGEDPGRRWTRPVPLVDVLRAAASEVEQYERIELASVPTADVAGRVVNDLVHLLAELLENATSFSSPQTRVRVTGHALPDGRVLVEIHDTGIGLSPDDLAEINERLANPPVVDVSVSRRMGLFVVGRLSLRHGIRIQLRPSDSGGTTALVMLPVDVTNAAERRGGATPGQAGQQRPQGPGQQGAMQGSPQGAPPVRGPQQRGAMPQAPGRTPLSGGPGGDPRPSLPPQQSEQAGLPRRDTAPGLPQGSSPMGGPRGPQQGGQPGGPRQPQAPAPQQPMQAQAPTGPQQSPRQQPAAPLDERQLWAEQPQHGSPAPGRPQPADALDSTAQFARPHFDEEPARPLPPRPAPQQASQGYTPQMPPLPQQPMPQQPMAPQQPQQVRPPQQPMPQQQPMALPSAPQDPANHPLTRALPPAEAGAGSSPIFEAMESNWFRSGRADRMRAVQVYGASANPAEGQAQGQPPQRGQQPAPQRPQPYQPQRPSTSAVPAPGAQQEQSLFGAPPQRPMPQRGVPDGASAPAGGASPWRASANDEVWRRAEQVREPSAGGVLPSGLPRRVPQANLVPGTAESAPAEGPQAQVSRSPEEVRGRLTNLRRGIQQGRQAGSDPHHQADQPNQRSGPYGSNPQER
ncbi:sensor histidine kinase [Streptacidiphilus cavernicola]|uniref:histidine kinase n=1 Tax=Streptacidiphilus cavernicola TaxID=3342716 RepID=A0ABV6W315_9ACTN